MLNGMSTAAKSYNKESKTNFSQMHRYSLVTLENLSHSVTPQAIRDWLRSLPPDSRASRSAWRGNSSGKATSETCGQRLSQPFASYDRDTCSWKTSQACLLTNTLDKYSEIWPRAGLMQDGVCYQLAPLVRHTHVKGCSYWPTPRAIMGKSGWAHGNPGKGRYRKEVIDRCNAVGWTPSPKMQEAIQGMPLGWTDLKPLGMDRYQLWLQQFGIY